MKILLFGANGQVGTELRRSLAPLGDLIVTTRSGCVADGTTCVAADFDVPASLTAIVDRHAPDIVVNAAAFTAVDRAEDEVATAYRINAEAPGAIAGACARSGAWLLHYSTDYVFGGTGTRPYREADPVGPVGVYGASKLAGERAIQASGAHHLIFRTAWVYAAHGHNFLRTMLRLAGERDELRVVADQVGSPTPASLIADVSAQVLAGPPTRSGIWHLTTTGQTSWHGFAQSIVDGAFARGLLAARPRVAPTTSAEYPTRALRPAYSVLDTARLQQDFGLTPPSWQDGVGKVLDALAQAGVR